MGLYIFIVVSLFLFVLLSAKKNATYVTTNGEISFTPKENYNFLIKILFLAYMIFFCILTGFRAPEIGNDTENYIGYFNIISLYDSVNEHFSIELGYQYFCLVISKFTDSPHIFLIICAVFSYVSLSILIFKYSKNLGFSLCLFFCMFFSVYTNTIRQGIAMAITLYAYFAIKEKKHVKAAILILIATTFHTSALLMFILYFYRFIPRKPIVVFIALAVIIGCSITGIISGILTFILQEYSSYFQSEYASSGWLGVSYYIFRNSVFYILAYLTYRKQEDNKSKLIISTFSLLLLMTGLGFFVNLFTRASEYLLILSVIELPNALYSSKIKNKNLLMYTICFIMLAYFLTTLIFRPEWNNLYPYKFY